MSGADEWMAAFDRALDAIKAGQAGAAERALNHMRLVSDEMRAADLKPEITGD